LAASFVNIALFNEEFKPGNGLLGAIAIYHGHMHVIHKDDQLFARDFGSKDTSRTFVNIVFDDGLDILGTGSGGEVHIESEEGFLRERLEVGGDDHGFGRPRITHK